MARLGTIAALTALLLTAGLAPAQALEEGRFVDRTALWERGGDVLAGFRNMYQFEVAYEPVRSDWPFHAWFFGWAAEDMNPNVSGCDAVYHARSLSIEGPWEVYTASHPWDDGAHPASWAPVLSAGDAYYDEWHNGDPSVVRVGRDYYMAFSSTGHNTDGFLFGAEGDVDGSILCIMGATSTDGVTWTKTDAPILLNPNDLGASHIPEGEAHLHGSYHRPSLLYEDGVFRLWFDYWAGPVQGTSMGYAENRGDFMRPEDWTVTRAGDAPCLPQWPNPDVVRVGDLYYSYADPTGYAPHVWTGRKLAEAVSRDGLVWTVLGYVEPDPDSAATHVPQAVVLDDAEGRTWIYLFYACQRGGDPYDYRYDRIRWMRREVTEEERASLASPPA